MRSRLCSHWQSNNRDKAPDCWTLEHWGTSLTRGGHDRCSRSRNLKDIVVCSPASNSRQRSRNFIAASYHICYQTASGKDWKVVIPASLVKRWCPSPSKTQYCFNMRYCVLRCYTTWPLATQFVWPWRRITLRTWQILSCCYQGKGGHSFNETRYQCWYTRQKSRTHSVGSDGMW